MIIDSHHHLWRYDPDPYGWIGEDMAVLRDDFWTAELKELAHQNGIDGFVTVQARQVVDETTDLLAAAEACDLIRAVVGWLPLAEADIDAHLDRFADAPKLKGLRHVIQDLPDDSFWMGADFNRGVGKLAGRGLTYDLLIYAHQLPTAIDFVDHHASLPIVLDHIAKPKIDPKGFDEVWQRNLRAFGRRDNVRCKWSGVCTEILRGDDWSKERWSVDIIRPYFDVVVDAFGIDRLMFGSDWPVCLLATEYRTFLEATKELVAGFSATDQEKFWGGNANDFYGLN